VKITIDSSEPLQDALRVLGALYDVDLSLSNGTAAGQQETAVPDTGKKSASRPKASSGSRSATRKKSAAAKSSTPVSNLELRSWARQNGFTVSERGRVATKVVAAYRAAHRS
jgi:hypothetical protein